MLPRNQAGRSAFWPSVQQQGVTSPAGNALRPARAALPVRAVIFDLDGTLLDTEPLYRRAFVAALANQGRRCDDALYARLIGLATPDRIAALSRAFGRNFPTDAFLADYYARKRAVAGVIRTKPGAAALLAWLAKHHIPAAIATSASAATASAHLRRTGMAGHFAAVVTRDDVRQRKPHPEPFLRAAAELGLPPSDCLAVEDSAHGMQAAHAAGMLSILVPDIAPVPADIAADALAILPDLHAVRCILTGN